jgi:hypothetical protein
MFELRKLEARMDDARSGGCEFLGCCFGQKVSLGSVHALPVAAVSRQRSHAAAL